MNGLRTEERGDQLALPVVRGCSLPLRSVAREGAVARTERFRASIFGLDIARFGGFSFSPIPGIV